MTLSPVVAVHQVPFLLPPGQPTLPLPGGLSSPPAPCPGLREGVSPSTLGIGHVAQAWPQ